MKTFYLFLKSKRTTLLLWLIVTGIFFLVPMLYDMPLYATGYASILALVCLLIGFLLSYARFCQKHQTLKQMQKSVLYNLDALPEPKDPVEQDYIDLITLLFNEKQHFITKKEEEWKETIDYYTLWAHQIKTPIAAMRLLLQSDDASGIPETKELAAELFSIEQYVEMALQFLRLGSSSTDYRFVSCELDDILRGVIRKFAPVFIRKKISLQYEPVCRQITTDEKWLSFVLEQILSNALKYSKKGFIRIYMDENQENTLVIEDSGIGINPEDLPRIFEKGYTGFNGRLDKRASGIGLYLCKRILTNLSFGISITSTPGEGTKAFLDFSQYHLTAD